MAFSDDDKERVRAANSIVDLVGEVTTVKRSGRNHMAVCVFHQEKTPSMSLDVARGLFYCHGCHTSGDLFDFVMESRGFTFPEALEFLAARAGITLTEDPGAKRRSGRRRALIEAIAGAVDFYNQRLMRSDDAGPARSYLRSRGYDGEVVARFKLGYAPPGDHLVRELRSRGIDERVIVEAGLARRGQGGQLYDYFRDRLLFPTNDVRGDPVGFGGRILGEGQPKYLNTPETPIYKKSKLLYGLDRARSAIQRSGEAVVVEGYTDVIGCHIAGMETAVATNGTALGDDHFDLLRRFCDRVVLAFDADAAGAGAALRGESLTIPARVGIDLRVASLPPGDDPADLVQDRRVGELESAVRSSRPLIEHWIEGMISRYRLDEPDARAEALAAVAPRLNEIDDPVVRSGYEDRWAHRLRVEVRDVQRARAVGRRSRADRTTTRQPSQPEPEPRRVRLEKELLRSLLAGRRSSVPIRDIALDLFQTPTVRTTFQELIPRMTHLDEETPVPIDGLTQEARELATELVMAPNPLEPVPDLIRSLNRIRIADEIRAKEADLAAIPESEQPGSPLFAELVRLREERRRLDGTA